ncbi:MAG: TlpA family protein disulfide reductase [Bacteroidaceae bacterium]|nr:TlpA family protein disulfide reductase [Bacteroidaceae bacterium]
MKKHNTYQAILLLFSFLLFSCINEEDDIQTGANLMVGDKIPSFSITMNNGETISDKDLNGQLSLIVFFNTKCKDCQKELPVIQRFYDTFPEYPLICISRAETESSIAEYWKENKLTLPYSAQKDKAIYEKFAYQGIPRIYIVSPEGIILHIFTDNPLADFATLVKAVQDTWE